MASILLSGPAGSGKSQEARRLLKAASVPTIMIDFQTIYAGLLGIERMPNGRYPERLEAGRLRPPYDGVREAGHDHRCRDARCGCHSD